MRRMSRSDWAAHASALLLALGGDIAVAQAADTLAPGLWRIVSTSTRDGVEQSPRTQIRCLTTEEANRFSIQPELDAAGTTMTCKSTRSQEIERGRTWQFRCTGAVSIEGTARYVIDNPHRYTLVFRAAATFSRTTFHSTESVEGQRIGECRG